MLDGVFPFLKENYFLIGYAITLVVSLAFYRRYFDTVLRYFPILITYTFLNEFFGYMVKTNQELSFFPEDLEYSSDNEILYNIYAVVFFGFFYFVYWQVISNEKFKKWIVIGGSITAISYVVSCFFQPPMDTQLFYATAIGSWVLAFSILLYFLDKSRNKEKIVQPYNLMFWVSLALLIFYAIFPAIYLIGYLDYASWEAYHLRLVLRILIVIMYTLFTVGFLRGRRHSFR